MATAKSAKDVKTAPSDGEAKAGVKAAQPATTSRGAPAPMDPPEVKAAALSPRARKAAAEKSAAAAKGAKAGKAGKAGGGKTARTADEFLAKKEPDLRADLRAFAEGRPEGWDHRDWLSFLDHLRERGHDTADADAIGLALERERLAVRLGQVQGMGPRRVQGLVERFDTVWSLRHAGVDDIAAVPGMNRALAEKVRQAVH